MPVEVHPKDLHNELLVSNVHPAEWENPVPQNPYNLVVLGAGAAGLMAATGAAGHGARVALVERELLGGNRLNVGCVASKCLIRSARAVADIRGAHAFGVHLTGDAEPDFAAVMERMRRLRAQISDHDSAGQFRKLEVDVFFGHAHFTGPETVQVGERTLEFRKAIIATGARAFHPPIEGLAEAGFITNETVFSLTERPRRLAVLGGGPLGCELAQVFQRLGCEVTIVEMAPQLLPREDPAAARLLAASLEREGVNVEVKSRVMRVGVSEQGKVLHINTNGTEHTVVADEILVGAGRVPNVARLDLGRAGVKYNEREGVMVDDYLRTTNPRVFAAGDVCLRFKFTHTADATARIVVQNALFWGRKKLSAVTIPWCTYTDPEIAHVGLYERDAEQRGIAVDTFVRRLRDVDRAVADGEEEGFVKVHVKRGTGRIVGATIVARHAGEMISELTLAIVAKIGLKTLSSVVHPYPTQAEAIGHVADAYNRTRLTPLFRKIVARLLAWQR